MLVESAQSVANRMELACWDETNDELIPELKGLPYILVTDGNGESKKCANTMLPVMLDKGILWMALDIGNEQRLSGLSHYP